MHALEARIRRLCLAAHAAQTCTLEMRNTLAAAVLRHVWPGGAVPPGIWAVRSYSFVPVGPGDRVACAVCTASARAALVTFGNDLDGGLRTCAADMPLCVHHCACMAAMCALVALPARAAHAPLAQPWAHGPYLRTLMRILHTWSCDVHTTH